MIFSSTNQRLDAVENDIIALEDTVQENLDIALTAAHAARTEGLREEIAALKESIARIDRVHAMILDFLKAEIVYVPERIVTEGDYIVEHEPEQQYIERKAKSSR